MSLKKFFKRIILVADLITFGRLFQSAGAATVKLRSPSVRRVFILVVAGESRWLILSYNYIWFYTLKVR